MSVALAVLGLALLVLVHEAGHFLASLAVGLRPRKFYVGFPPPLVRVRRGGIEYGIGAIPLGGFVSIPGMHRPIPHDAERRFSPAVAEVPELAGPLDRLKRTLEAGDTAASLAALDELEEAMRGRRLSEAARSSAEKGFTDLRDALGPRAYWKAPTWKRLVAIAAGPGANVLLALALLTLLFTRVGGDPSRTIAAVTEGSPAQAAGLRPGDRVLAVNGDPVDGVELGERIAGSRGRPLVLTVERDGELVSVGPVRPRRTSEGYRLGIVREGTGMPLPEAVGTAVRVTAEVSLEIVRALGRLVTSEGREDVASPIGITQVSSEAIEQGADYYLWVLALISISLALLNLLPLLPLDGGHVLFALLEGARGRAVRRQIYERVSFVGLAIVLFLFFIGLSNDIGRLS
ncbi:MAG TPA: M50 family metallopeptidase [Gaiellaceae bacterium]|nr:M50 family metallopeptidase [Gaiellaceae bacterium]